MKTKNSILILLIIFAMLLPSCEKTLKEDFYSGASVELLASTASGFESLVAGCYVTTKLLYGKEYGWDISVLGTDCWTWAGDADAGLSLSQYTSDFNNTSPSRLAIIWAELYKGLNACNTVLSYLPDAAISDELKLQREGEVRFLRALYLFNLVEIWGGVALTTEPITEPEYTMERAGVQDFYTQIFKDLDFAVDNLPESLDAADYGRAYKYAAWALRARVNLYWASEYMSGNCYDGKTYPAIDGIDHYQQALNDADSVIANSAFQLYDSYSDIWLMSNNASANVNTENIWAINYSNTEYAAMNVDPTEYNAILGNNDPKPFNDREGGNQGHMMFGMRWFQVEEDNVDVLVRDDLEDNTSTEPTRPFCRYMPTKFMIDLYDAKVDERFYGSFNNVFYANNTNLGSSPDANGFYPYPTWNATETLRNGTTETIDSALVGKKILEIGDTAFVLFKDTIIPEDMYYQRGWGSNPSFILKTGHFYFVDMSHMYNADGTIIETTTFIRRKYFDLQKWYDRTRPHNANTSQVVGSQRGKRDFIVFRLPEMYYIVAEASLALNQNQEAYNKLKDIADKRSYSGDGTDLLHAYGIDNASDVTLDFILDDRARELAGEQQRWFDLKRTGTLLERVRAHNPDAALNIQEKHLVRPIPQIELDAIENKDDYLTGWGIY